MSPAPRSPSRRTAVSFLPAAMDTPISRIAGSAAGLHTSSKCLLDRYCTRPAWTISGTIQISGRCTAYVHACRSGAPTGRGPFEVKYTNMRTNQSSNELAGTGTGPRRTETTGELPVICICSAIDLTRVMAAIEGSRGATYLPADTMVESPRGSDVAPRTPTVGGVSASLWARHRRVSHGGPRIGFRCTALSERRLSTCSSPVNPWPPGC